MAPEESAEAAGLRYVSDSEPGISREPADDGFIYRSSTGRQISDGRTLKRIAGLAIPPAWTDVWICRRANGHLQATGRDARGRKQYRYHPRWREVRDETKYGRMVAFGEALPGLRERVAQDLARRGLPREKVLAALTRLLEATHIRVGNEEYARENRSYGLTTLRDRHVKVGASKLTFSFRGKAGKRHTVELHDRRLARIVQRCRDLPGQQLFQYIDEDGRRQSVGSGDVNAYLRDATGQPFTAKDFRTWTGTVLAARLLREAGPAASQREAKHNISEAIKATAEELGNTPSICRKCYVHPALLDAYQGGRLAEALGPDADEAAVLAFLRGLAHRDG